MATSLQQQLAAINAKSTDQLNLKAQKQRHARSLLFEAREAAGQSYDTLYQICIEGFDDLCQLDTRFLPFGQNLFAATSVEVEREHMTAKENVNLDAVIEQFFGLVSGRLLLRPAQKSVEWLVRRWRAHENNTSALLLAFLPYHAQDIFPTLLSILPTQLPPNWSFLRPYVAALQCPPRHAIIAAAISTPAFSSDLSGFVLRTAKRRHHASALIGFWASVTAQAVNGMLDGSQSGRPAVRKQRIEDVLLRILPVLQEAVSIQGVSELYMATCMIMTIIATKAQLDDRVLDAMTEAIASAWTDETYEDGLLCLAVLAEDKDSLQQPAAVTSAIFANSAAVDTLQRLSQRHRVGKLALITALSSISSAGKHASSEIIVALCESAALEEQHQTLLVRQLLEDLAASTTSDAVKGRQRNLLHQLSSNQSTRSAIENAAQEAEIDLAKLGLKLSDASQLPQIDMLDEPMDDIVVKPERDLEEVISALPSLTQDPCSFLSANGSAQARPYLDAFELAAHKQTQVDRFLALGSFYKDDAKARPELLTFLTFTWTCSKVSSARVAALRTASHTISDITKPTNLDFQNLVPYAIAALGDSAQAVRKAASGLVLAIVQAYSTGTDKKSKKSSNVWCNNAIYARDTVHHLDTQEAYKFLSTVLRPVLEDCVLDASFIARALVEQLNGTDLKQSLRQEVCLFLASHASVSPILPVQLSLLQVLAHLGKIAGQARTKIIVSFAKQRAAGALSADDNRLNHAVIRVLSPRTAEEIDTLTTIATGTGQDFAGLAFKRLTDIFGSMKPQQQVTTADFLLEQSISASDSSLDASTSGLDALRSLSLPGDVLAHLLDALPSATTLQDQERPAKRQRTTKSTPEKPKQVDQAVLNSALRRITLVLELVESASSSKHAQSQPQLLKGLFHFLSELHRWRTMTDSDLVYIQTLLLSDLLAVVSNLDPITASQFDRSIIRTDLIVEALRSTNSPQAHNTALLLISKLATLVPDTVLHSVMPLFTFMSSNTLRQADQYSSHVINMTVESVVPPLAASLKKKGQNLVAGAAELLLSFTAAFEHMPLHRRLDTFQHLVKTLGPDDVLFAVVAMLVERYPEDNSLPQFLRQLCNGCSVQTQLLASKKYLDLVVDATKPKRALADSILGFGEKNSAQVADSVATLLEGLPLILENPVLHKKLAVEMQTSAETAEHLRTTYGELLERIVSFTRMPVTKGSVDVKDPRITSANDHALSALLGLMPTEEFIVSSASLMQTGSEQVRTQVFASLTTRVNSAKQGNASLRKVFVEALPNCTAFLIPSQPISVRHAALECVDGIVEKFGRVDRAACARAVVPVAGKAALESDVQSLKVRSLLCLASMVESLAEEMLGDVPGILDRALGYLEGANESERFELRDAVFSFLNALLDQLPYVLGADFLDRALVVAASNVLQEGGSERAWSVQQFGSLVARKIALSDLAHSMDRTWGTIVKMPSSESVAFAVEILQQAIKAHTKANVTKNAQAIFPVVLKTFDLQRLRSPEGREADDDATAVDIATQTSIDVTLKLNDTTFRPFFIRLVAWAADELHSADQPGCEARGIALFGFVHRLFEQLGSIVTSYASYLLDYTIATLDTSAEGPLIDLALKTLESSFRNDQDDFWAAPQHFDLIRTPLIALLSKSSATAPTATEAITSLAAAVAGSADHLKALNAQLMALFRHTDADVRLAAVKCERAVTDRLTFDWLALLPEMLPMISELLEDDDERVEREVGGWVEGIEGVTGESLEGMLA